MYKRVITLEVLDCNRNTLESIILTNSNGDMFEIPDNNRNEELIDFIGRSELKSKELEMIALIKHIYEESDYKSWNWIQIQDRCYKILRYFNIVREAGTPSFKFKDDNNKKSEGENI